MPGPSREMTLDECVDTLPEWHGARDEYASLKREITRLQGELERPAPGSPCAGCLEFRAPDCYHTKCGRYVRWFEAIKMIDDEKDEVNAKVAYPLNPIDASTVEPGGVFMSTHDTIQPNGVCWDCGGQAIPAVNCTETQTSIGWQCECGRYWPVLMGDVLNWAREASTVGGTFRNQPDTFDQWKKWFSENASHWNNVQDVEGEIRQGRTGKSPTD